MNNLLTVIKKELTDIFRDRKTVAFTLILPILIYPIMFKVMGSAISSSEEDAEKEIRLVIEGNKEASLAQILKSQANIIIEENLEDPSKALKDGDIQLIVKIPESIDTAIKEKQECTVEVLIDEQSTKSTIASGIIKSLFNEYSKVLVEERLNTLGVDSTLLTPFSIEEKSGVSKDGEINGMATMMMGMLPAMIVILLLTPTMGLASDLGAGEKERGTFEPLLSTAVSRGSILWGKIISLSCVATMVLIASMISLFASFRSYVSTLSGQSIDMNIDGKAIALIILFSLLLIITICTIQIGVSIYARSTKEANTYLSGVLMPMMILTFIPMFKDIKGMSSIFYHIPLINSVSVMKEFMLGIYDMNHIFIVLAWHIAYVVIVVIIAKILFSREEVIFRS